MWRQAVLNGAPSLHTAMLALAFGTQGGEPKPATEADIRQVFGGKLSARPPGISDNDPRVGVLWR